MAYNKVIYGSRTLIDLTGDTVEASKVLNGVTFHDKSGTLKTGSCTFDVDSTDATALVSELLEGKTAYARGTKLIGNMPNKGSVTGTISTKTGQYTIPLGYHDGGGKVSIAATEQAKLVPGNIKAGVVMLGVTGDYSGEDISAQDKTVTPTVDGFDVNPDEGFDYLSHVSVSAIPYVESANAAGGTTVTIA